MRIPFHDLDPAGYVWHGRYFKYFEQARAALMEKLNYSYLQMQDSGLLWPVVDVQVQYRQPLTLEQTVRVTASLVEWELRLVVDYTVADVNGVICTRGRTVQVAVDENTRELRLGVPASLAKSIERLLDKTNG